MEFLYVIFILLFVLFCVSRLEFQRASCIVIYYYIMSNRFGLRFSIPCSYLVTFLILVSHIVVLLIMVLIIPFTRDTLLVLQPKCAHVCRLVIMPPYKPLLGIPF